MISTIGSCSWALLLQQICEHAPFWIWRRCTIWKMSFLKCGSTWFHMPRRQVTLTFQAQGIRSIPRFQADPSFTGLAFKWQSYSQPNGFLKSPGENAWWVSSIPQKRRKASVEMRCAPWLRRSVSCLRARFHFPTLKKRFLKGTQRGIQTPSLSVHKGWQRCECYFGKRASSRHFESYYVWYLSVKFVSDFWFVKCEIVKQIATVGWTIATLL